MTAFQTALAAGRQRPVIAPLDHGYGRMLAVLKSLQRKGACEHAERAHSPSDARIAQAVPLRVIDDGRVIEEQKDVTVRKDRYLYEGFRDTKPGKGAEEFNEGGCKAERGDHGDRADYPHAEEKTVHEPVSVGRDLDPQDMPCPDDLFSGEEELEGYQDNDNERGFRKPRSLSSSDSPQALLLRKRGHREITVLVIEITARRDGLMDGLSSGLRIISAVSVIAVLGPATPFVEFLGALAWLRVPKAFIEISIFAYRYIFLLLDDASVIYYAQKNRLGYSSVRLGVSSFGVLAGALVLKAFENSRTCAIAMIQRGYDGSLPSTVKGAERRPFGAVSHSSCSLWGWHGGYSQTPRRHRCFVYPDGKPLCTISG